MPLPKDNDILFRDSQGYQAIYHDDENGGYVTYKRYRDQKYQYLTAEKAAEKILAGKEIKESYIEKLTVDEFKKVTDKLSTNNFIKTGKTFPIYTLKQPIICTSCLIGAVDLTCVAFNNEVNFIKVTFSDKAYFIRATFSGEVNFRETNFSGKAVFEQATFSGKADFVDATFSSEAVFWAATFNHYAYFGHAIFSENTCFNEIYMLDGNFEYARFEKTCNMNSAAVGKIDFTQAIFAENLLFSASSSEYALTKKQNNMETNIQDKRKKERKDDEQKELEDLLNLLNEWKKSKRSIYSVDFGNTLVQGELRCDFEYLNPDKDPNNKKTPVIKPHRRKDWKEAQKQYSWLKEQYRKQGRYTDEDDAHWWASYCDTQSIDNIVKRCIKWFLFEFIFGYGVRPWRIVGTIGAILVGCSVAYYFGKLAGNPPFDSYHFFNALYFSVITFATVGYGDISATGWAAALAMIEGLAGVILNAALIVTIFRKIVR